MNKILRSGNPFIWLTGGALAFSLIMVIGLIVLVLVNGLGFFWPSELIQFKMKDKSVVLGEITQREEIPDYDRKEGAPVFHRLQIKVANRDFSGPDFIWINEPEIVEQSTPDNAVSIERREWGSFFGYVQGLKEGSNSLANDSAKALALLPARLDRAEQILGEVKAIEKGPVGAINRGQEKIRLARKALEQKGAAPAERIAELDAESKKLHDEYLIHDAKLEALRLSLTDELAVSDASGKKKMLPVAQIVRVSLPNQMGFFSKVGIYVAKIWEFLWDEPRESNTEGGVFPAIFGTILMVMIMSVLVTPLGVLAAFYLREYAKQGPFVSAVRIAVNNLAGVPSIVFGVFGVGFFIYFIGGNIDRLFFSDTLPAPTFGTGGILWASLTLALLTVPVVIVATEEGLAAIPRGTREASLALGATKFETTWRVVLPAVMPSILTGLILAMARAAGEVAPLMITGVVKLAPTLPLDGEFPFLHMDRKFMHLGFHIYDVGFQSPNVDAARPMVFMTTLLLLVIVLILNIGAIMLRNRLRKKFATSMV